VTRALIPPGEASAAPLQPEWRQRLEAWRTFLTQCGSKPNRKSVHALRALTLRLRVELEHSLPEQAEDPDAAHAFQRWSKDAKKLRKVLGPVRDADVYLARLDSLRNSFGEVAEVQGMPEGGVQLSVRCTREIEKLENRLRRKRLAGIEKLVAVLRERGKRLNRLSNEMEAAFAPYMSSKAPSTAQATLEIIAGLGGELPSLDATNLHAYRKRLKPALYLAEISAAADPQAGRLAITFRKIHDAIGEWHDWQALTQEADRVLHSHGKPDGLVPLLEERTAKALHRALGQCRRSAARYVKNVGKILPSQRKKPVAAERGLPLEEEDLEAEICR
jgi:CHAD domain-containing protein